MPDNNWNDILGKIRTELSDLSKYVDNAKKGIENLESTVKVSTEKFPEATKHLSTVTGDLEVAANNIISILEGLLEEKDRAHKLFARLIAYADQLPDAGRPGFIALAKDLDGINSKSRANLMDIFSSLSFHDLSGQKLRKVMSAIADVEKKVAELARTFGFVEEQTADKDAVKGKEAAKGKDAASNQDTVDMILKQMGGKSTN